jgi:serine/threonine-protein kinase
MIGTVAGNFKILEEIGEGGMGKVYRGVDTMLDREVAIKVLRSELTSQPHLVERFRTEAQTLAKLNHPNIALLYAFLKHEEHFFMVMEFVRGNTLDKHIRKTGLLSYEQALKVFLYVLDALGYAHSMNVVHRDIKPNNIMLADNQEVKVMDFGIARVVGSERMTREGSMIGTPEYMAPEQIRGQEVDPRTDIYALGILLYEMLTGRLPFVNANHFELMKAHIEAPPPFPRQFAPHIPPSMEQLMLRALAKRKEDRYASAYEFRDAILACPDMPPLSLPGLAARGSAPITGSSLGRISQPIQPLPTHGRQTVDVRQFEQQQRAGTQPVARDATPAPLNRSGSFNDAGATQYVPAAPAEAPAQASGGIPKPLLFGGIGLVAVALIGLVIWINSGKGGDPPPPPPDAVKVDMADVKGGAFSMGRADETPLKGEDLAFVYMQTPAHTELVRPFAIDRTEVTNAEYGQFVKATNHPAPKDWNGNQPLAGFENYPVRNVSYDDAVKFAEWRSKRDKAEYRLPTEIEWERAAKGAEFNNRFPWGNDWIDGAANVEAMGPKPVGSFAKGDTATGIKDMIGNVAEWTSSKSSIYPENSKIDQLDPAEMEKYIVRGGSYESSPVGPRPVSVTARGSYPPTEKLSNVGFRLVKPAQ